MNAEPPAHPAHRRTRDLVVYLLIVAAVAIPVTVTLVRQERALAPASAWERELDEHGQLRPVAEVARLVREAKLITMSIDAQVRATVVDERWFGTASATVVAPVRYRFGVDLQGLGKDAIRYDFLGQRYVVLLPPPERLAIEVDGSHPVAEVVEASGTRLKNLGGQEQLVKAQRALYTEAERQTLAPAQREQVRQATREQVEHLVARIVGPEHPVRVLFRDDWGHGE